jgi:beta-glucosidase
VFFDTIKEMIKYVGSATSHFQAEPLIYDTQGRPLITSDWELELQKNLKREPNHIKGFQSPEEFPHFLGKKENYIKRSSELGENMFRFSLDFPRLCPKEGEFNAKLMEDYVRTLALIRAHGGEPMLTLYHWPMPRSLLEMGRSGNIKAGAWENPSVIKHFRFYVRSVFGFLDNKDNLKKAFDGITLDKATKESLLGESLVRYFISINEPINVLAPNYLIGIYPPFKKWRFDVVPRVFRRLVEANDIAFEEIKKSGGMVGVTHPWQYFDGWLGGPIRFLNEWVTKQFERNGSYSDFMGLQYYARRTVPSFRGRDGGYSDNPYFGDVYPEGILRVLERMHALYPKKKIFITEFGFSDRSDKRRPHWILETTRYILEAVRKKIPVEAVLLWSLVNNFEWNLGMDQKFGLFDERELEIPPVRERGTIRSWEAWIVAVSAMRSSSRTSLREFESCRERARVQYYAAHDRRN